MNITPSEAEEALVSIEAMLKKTRRSIANSGAYIFLFIWGTVWLVGFLSSHFFSYEMSGKIWMVIYILGGFLSAVFGTRMNTRIRNPSTSKMGKRIAWFWFLLFVVYCSALFAVVQPMDGKQASMIIVLFVLMGWMAMSMLLSFGLIWPGLTITALALIGYFLLPNIFYLWMAVLGGGGMIALGLYIRWRW